METDQRNYSHLLKLSRDIRMLTGINSILNWDQETYMPEDAASIRAEQLKVLEGLLHEKETGRKYTNALSKLIDLKTGKVLSKKISEPQKAALREWRRDYLIAKALPKRFVEDFTKLTSQALHAWHHAKKQDAFQQFAPFLDRIVVMLRKKADYLGYKKHPYDALLNLYEPEMSVAEISPLFAHLRKEITTLLKTIMAKQKVDDSFLKGNFDQEKQMKFGHLILKTINYDLAKGRLDISGHPFSSSSHPTDSRITTRINSHELISNIRSVLHEAGHAFYEMGLPVEHYGSPLCQAISMGMHESQSRWWETRIGLCKGFWEYFLPLLKNQFKGKFDQVTTDQFHRAINKVEPTLIRVEADELTYSLHVILRYELELALIEGSLKVRDLPAAWNAKMKELLGVVPQNNAEGCLQDIHWSMGALGYFPTYTLGNMYGAHMFGAFAQKHPDWEKRIAKGEFQFIKDWLTEAVHQHGRRYTSPELLQKVSGKPFTAEAYTTYLKDKYSKLCR